MQSRCSRAQIGSGCHGRCELTVDSRMAAPTCGKAMH